MKFSEMILTERKSRKLSQEDMGFDLNVSTQIVNFWERGIRSPRLDEAKRVADVLGYEINFVKKEQEK